MIRLACLRALALLVCCVPLAARAQYYNYFSPGPAGQVEKSDGSPALAAAAATDVAALFTGCSASAPALGYLGGCLAVGAGTVTSVAFSDDSTAPLYAVSGSPCSVTCAIVITLETQAANCVIAGPSSGAPAQPACRALVTADLPPSGVTAASYTNANVTVDETGRITAASNGSSSGCVFAAPSAAVALTAVTGTSGDCMDAGSAPALSQAISPTMTGLWNFSPSSGVAITVTAPADTDALDVSGTSSGDTQVLWVDSGNATAQHYDLKVSRTTSAANSEAGGANIDLRGNNPTGSETVIQNSGGQTEIWQSNGSSAEQVLAFDSSWHPYLPTLSAATGARTGAVCWDSTGELTYDPTNTCITSSARVKERIAPLSGGLREVLSLAPVSFLYRPEHNPDHLGEQVGFIAEQVARVDPRLIERDSSGLPVAVEYQQLTALLVSAIQTQQRELDVLLSLTLLCIGAVAYALWHERSAR